MSSCGASALKIWPDAHYHKSGKTKSDHGNAKEKFHLFRYSTVYFFIKYINILLEKCFPKHESLPSKNKKSRAVSDPARMHNVNPSSIRGRARERVRGHLFLRTMVAFRNR